MTKRLLILENGMIFEGEAFGADLFVTGEIVFNTGMTGYQESITDQSYNGQILTFTYPLVGNYGVNRDDYESILPTCKGVVVYEYSLCLTALKGGLHRLNACILVEVQAADKVCPVECLLYFFRVLVVSQHGTCAWKPLQEVGICIWHA